MHLTSRSPCRHNITYILCLQLEKSSWNELVDLQHYLQRPKTTTLFFLTLYDWNNWKNLQRGQQYKGLELGYHRYKMYRQIWWVNFYCLMVNTLILPISNIHICSTLGNTSSMSPCKVKISGIITARIKTQTQRSVWSFRLQHWWRKNEFLCKEKWFNGPFPSSRAKSL